MDKPVKLKRFVTCTEDEFHEGTLGACLACGEQAFGVEPDARAYKCESCDALQVYGYEELLIMGKLTIEDEE